jgi:hypothetical protein
MTPDKFFSDFLEINVAEKTLATFPALRWAVEGYKTESLERHSKFLNLYATQSQFVNRPVEITPGTIVYNYSDQAISESSDQQSKEILDIQRRNYNQIMGLISFYSTR